MDRLSSGRKYSAYSTLKAPDKGEVGGSSPPRPTIQITSKYAAILTFPLFGDLPQKTVLSTLRLAGWQYTQGRLDPSGEGRTARIDLAMSRMPPCQVEGGARQCKTLQACGRSGKTFLVSFRGDSSVGENACLSRRRSRVRVPSLPPFSPCVRPLRRHAGPGGQTSQYKRVCRY